MVTTAANIGYITQIIGPVIDVEYPSGTLPKVFNDLCIKTQFFFISFFASSAFRNRSIKIWPYIGAIDNKHISLS